MILLVVIYIAFIGIGVPHSLIGAAWPAVCVEWGISESYISFVTVVTSGCIALSSILSAKVINRFGTCRISILCTAVAAISMIGFATAPNFITMCIWGVPLGASSGVIDAALNNYVSVNFKAKYVSLLHCFYGIGVTGSVYLMSHALSNSSWRVGYVYAVIILAVITVMIIASAKMWKKNSESSEEEKTKPLTFTDIIHMPKIFVMWIVIFITNVIETVCGSWGSMFLIATKNISEADGALALTFYYAGLTLGRLVSGLIAKKIHTWNRVYIGLALSVASVLLFFVPGPVSISIIALFALGFGNGSIYPNLISLTPYNFGKDISQAVMGSQIGSAYIGGMLATPMFAIVNNSLGLKSFPGFVLVLCIVMLLGTIVFVKSIKKEGKYSAEA